MTSKIRIILSLSLLLNLALFGLSGALLWRASHPPMPPEIAAAPPEIAQKLRQEIPQAMARMRAARADLVKAMTAEPFDAQAFDAAADKFSAMHREGFDARIRTAREIAAKLSQEDRKKLAVRMFPDRRPGEGSNLSRKKHETPPTPKNQ